MLFSANAGSKDVKLVVPGAPVRCWGGVEAIKKLKTNIKFYEEVLPVDGISFGIGPSNPFCGRRYRVTENDKEKVKAWRALMKETKHYKYNFAMCLIDQDIPKWFDDEYWDIVVYNFRVLAKMAKKAGFVGILFDPEGYGDWPVIHPWSSVGMVKGFPRLKDKPRYPGDPKRTPEDYLKIAFKRGQQVGAGVFKEFPECNFFAYYWWSFCGRPIKNRDGNLVTGDLCAQFAYGVLDVAPPTAKVTDGDEWTGYMASGENAYKRMLNRRKTACGTLKQDGNQKFATKYLKNSGYAVAFYQDTYLPKPELTGSDYDKAARDQCQRFRENLLNARRTASDFIWLYGEKRSWWPDTPKDYEQKIKRGETPRKTWYDAIPGLTKPMFGSKFKEFHYKKAENEK